MTHPYLDDMVIEARSVIAGELRKLLVRAGEVEEELIYAKANLDESASREASLRERINVLEDMRKRAQADYIARNSDGEADCVTPYDLYDEETTEPTYLKERKEKLETDVRILRSALEETVVSLDRHSSIVTAKSTLHRNMRKALEATDDRNSKD